MKSRRLAHNKVFILFPLSCSLSFLISSCQFVLRCGRKIINGSTVLFEEREPSGE